jgi:hypothetical protein
MGQSRHPPGIACQSVVHFECYRAIKENRQRIVKEAFFDTISAVLVRQHTDETGEKTTSNSETIAIRHHNVQPLFGIFLCLSQTML